MSSLCVFALTLHGVLGLVLQFNKERSSSAWRPGCVLWLMLLGFVLDFGGGELSVCELRHRICYLTLQFSPVKA